MEELGRELIHGRRIVLAELDREWRAALPAELEWITVLLVADADRVPDDAVRGLARTALARRCAWVSTWGIGCERVHDLFDDEYLAAPEGRPFLMSDWHADASLPSALYYGLVGAFPTGEASYAEARASTIVLLVQPAYANVVRRLVADQSWLHDLVMREDAGDGIHATWSRRLGPVTVLAFRDGRSIVSLGRRDRPALVELGWTRWRPNFVRFPRRRRLS